MERHHGPVNIGSSTIYDIKKREKLHAFIAMSEAPTCTKHVEARLCVRKAKLLQLDAALFTWFSGKRSEGKPVTRPILIEKAKQFH